MIGWKGGVGLPGLGGLGLLMVPARWDLKAEMKFPKGTLEELRGSAADKLRLGAPVTREEAAAFLGVNRKKLYRLEKERKLHRCPDSKRPVLYAAGDVLRLASALGKER